jgi:hypothetical protein
VIEKTASEYLFIPLDHQLEMRMSKAAAIAALGPGVLARACEVTF